MDTKHLTKYTLLRKLTLAGLAALAFIGVLMSGAALVNAVTPFRVAALPDGHLGSSYAAGSLLIAHANGDGIERGQVVVLPNPDSTTVGRVTDFIARDNASYSLTVRADDGTVPESYLYRTSASIYTVTAAVPFIGYLFAFFTSFAGLVTAGVVGVLLAGIYLFGLHRLKTKEERELDKVARLRSRAKATIEANRRADGINQIVRIFEETPAS